MTLIGRLKVEEGFRGMPYDDHLGFPTIGYGTKLPLTKEEGILLAKHRVYKMMEELADNKGEVKYYPSEVQEILYEMSYQMGVPGVLKFRRMFEALDNKDSKRASKEMLDSLWAKQTPERAKRLSKRMADVKL